MPGRWRTRSAATLVAMWLCGPGALARGSEQATGTPAAAPQGALIEQYCIRCHNSQLRTGGLALDIADVERVGEDPAVWERAVRKLRARAMPPGGLPRPDEAAYDGLVSYLETELDLLASTNPNPGRTDTFRRLNRTEYRNAIRDLLALEVDVTSLLPRDDASYGFDNVGVANLSPMLMERYLSAAQKVSRLAVGSALPTPGSHVVVLPADLTQEDHFAGLPFGTRGGTAVAYVFPRDGEYEIQVRLSRNRNENVEGLTEPHQLELTLDGDRLRVFEIVPNRNELAGYYADEDVDKGLQVRVAVTAGPHVVGAAFLKKSSALIETERQPYDAHFNMDRHPRTQPGVHAVSIAGPFGPTAIGDTPSRRQVFVCDPVSVAEEPSCAREIISTLARRAYRRPVTDADLEMPLAFYADARAVGSFAEGIETALRALLASTEFLFRIERDPEGFAAGTPYRVSELELASRLSFFLWSSLPDDELLAVAERGELRKGAVLENQVRRMLDDPRAGSLATNFAGQWLYLRNLTATRPNLRLFPDFDDNLRRSFRRETELLFRSILEEDRNVVDLLRADYTFLNERLARHYGIPNVYGDHFRRVSLDPDSERLGLLGHGSILTVTSYATRTSPVLRGKWILDNILGMPPPPPPPNVASLDDDDSEGEPLTMRERMAQHRANPACATCHQLMDPAGLSMENFDAIGRWRARGEGRRPIDVSGSLPGGQEFEGVGGLREALLARSDLFVRTMTEKLLTFALGRGVDDYDGPAVRQIVREAAKNDNRFSSLVLAMVKSTPFQMRRSQ